jgi:hypothetical protein
MKGEQLRLTMLGLDMSRTIEEHSSAELRGFLKKAEGQFRQLVCDDIPGKWEEYKCLRFPERFGEVAIDEFKIRKAGGREARREKLSREWRNFGLYWGLVERVLRVREVITRKRKEGIRLGAFTQRALGLRSSARSRRSLNEVIVEQLMVEELKENRGYREILRALDDAPDELQHHPRFLRWRKRFGIDCWGDIAEIPEALGLFQKFMSDVRRRFNVR